jgi:hypothetical protein
VLVIHYCPGQQQYLTQCYGYVVEHSLHACGGAVFGGFGRVRRGRVRKVRRMRDEGEKKGERWMSKD